jgi:hypothetical protein
MPNFIISYHGSVMPKSPEEGAAHMAKWQQWAKDLGAAAVNPGTPLGKAKLVSSKGVSDEEAGKGMSGYTVVEAADMDAAVAMAKGCPYVDFDTAYVRVAQMMKMG